MKRTRSKSILSLVIVAITAFFLAGCVRPSTDPVIEIPSTSGEQPIVIPQEEATPAGENGETPTEGYPVDESGDDIAEPTVDSGTDSGDDSADTADSTDGSADTNNDGEAEPTGEEGEEGEGETDGSDSTETPPADGVYTVQSGDTLGKIAERFGVSIDDIAAASGLTNIHSLDVGQELTIPEAGFAETAGTTETGEQVHVVRSGDTLYSIGVAYGVTVQALQQHNGIANADSLDIGQEILIPAGE